MICIDRGGGPIDVGPPTLACFNYGKQFTVMYRVVALRTRQGSAVVCNGTPPLCEYTTHSGVRGVGFDEK